MKISKDNKLSPTGINQHRMNPLKEPAVYGIFEATSSSGSQSKGGIHHPTIEIHHPTTAPPKISQVELIRKRISSPRETSVMRTARGSAHEARPNSQVTAAIKPREATLTPSSRPPSQAERRIRGMNGLEIATKRKEGRKMPRVARSPPETPPRRYPMKVAVVRTGPGVIWPMAIASNSCWSVSQP